MATFHLYSFTHREKCKLFNTNKNANLPEFARIDLFSSAVCQNVKMEFAVKVKHLAFYLHLDFLHLH